MTNETNEKLPEKSCSIERLVTIKEDVKRVLSGEKTATRRNGVYAYPGETTVIGGQEIKVDALYRQTLGEMTDEDAQQEGFATMKEYKASILAIHPEMPWLPQMSVWVHRFSLLQK